MRRLRWIAFALVADALLLGASYRPAPVKKVPRVVPITRPTQAPVPKVETPAPKVEAPKVEPAPVPPAAIPLPSPAPLPKVRSAEFEQTVELILKNEGSEYTNDANDPGGPTKYGITLKDVRLYVKGNATWVDVRALDRETAVTIYYEHYWKEMNGDALPEGLDYSVVDFAVNSGLTRAGLVLRRVVGLSGSDWRVTPEVIAAAKKKGVWATIQALNAERLAFLKRLGTWAYFGNGWASRVASVRAKSLRLAGAPIDIGSLAYYIFPVYGPGKGTL